MRDSNFDFSHLSNVVAGLEGILHDLTSERAKKLKSPKPPDKDLQLTELIKQLKQKTLNFTFYFLTGKDFKTTNTEIRNLTSPVVTVALAKIKGGYARGVGVCHPKDTPNKRDGKIAAAKVLLYALKKGQCLADPTSPLVLDILNALYNDKIVSLTCSRAFFIVGTKRAKLTPEEKKIAAGFNREKKIKHFTCVAKHWHVVETVRCETLKEAQEYIRIWKDLSPEDRGAIETLKDNLS